MANEIQELKFQVGEAWKGVYSSSTAYGLANVVQDPTGLSIYRSLKSGNVGHPLSNASWWFRIIDMSSIKAESDRIAALNEAIAQDEALRVAAEELRQQHEAERVAAETQRNEAEQARISAEQARVNAESARAIAEQQRITAEESRLSAESARVQAEQARVLAETLRANAEDQRAANEQNRIAAEQQRIERAEQDHQRAESDHATYVDSLGAFDISSYHATDGVLAKYADLTAALGTGGANIPDDLRKGGMSVKFVQSSDNKYVQYRLMTQDWSVDVSDWSFCGDDVLIEHPEFIKVETDKDGRLLEYTTIGNKKVVNKDVEINGSAKVGVNLEISNIVFKDEQTIDNNLEMLLDDNDRIISNRDENGVLHENIGIISPSLKADFVNTNSLNLSYEGLQELKSELELQDASVYNSVLLSVLKNAFNMPIPHIVTSNPGQDDDGKEIPYELSILNVIKRANQVRNLTWYLKSMIPATGESYRYPGTYQGLPYSSCMQNDKMVGSDISIMTFMTAMNNPYSMAYTENLRENGSVYGFTYAQPARSTVAGWCGIVCNTFVEFAIGMNTQYDTGSWKYLAEIGEIVPVYPNSAQGVRIGDMLWREGHGRLVQNVWRDENGIVTKVEVSENGAHLSTIFSAADFDTNLSESNGLIYRYARLYENDVFNATPFDNLNDGPAPTFVYNNDICTFAGDYACFREGFRIVVNYNLASSSSDWTSIELYKNDVLYGTYLLSSDTGTYDRGPENYPSELAQVLPSHSYDLTSLNLTYGKYKARLTDGNGNYSDYTYFEILETDSSYEFLANGNIKVSFSSSNGAPSFVRFHKENGGPKAIYAFTDEDIANGYCILDLQDLVKRQYNNLYADNTYCKVYFVGDYGRVTNEPILINI